MIRWDDEMRWPEMKQKETRNSETCQANYGLFIENILSSLVLNTEKGGEKRDLTSAYNLSSQESISGQTEMRSTHKAQTSRRSSTPIKRSCRDFSKVFWHLKMQIHTMREPMALDNSWPHPIGNQHGEKHDS